MREKIDRVKPGTLPSASNFDKLVEGVKRASSNRSGSFMSSFQGNSFSGQSAQPPHFQCIAEVVTVVSVGLYLIRIRYYDPYEADVNSRWKSSDELYELDSTDVRMSLYPDDRLAVWWNQERGMFIPCQMGVFVIPFELKTNLSPGGSATAYVLNVITGTPYPILSKYFTVHDILQYSGTGRDTYEGYGDYLSHGDYGFAFEAWPDYWVIISMNQISQVKEVRIITNDVIPPSNSANVFAHGYFSSDSAKTDIYPNLVLSTDQGVLRKEYDGPGGNAGSKVNAAYFGGKWYILDGEFETEFFAKVSQTSIAQGALGLFNIWWSDYGATTTLVDSTKTVYAYNRLSANKIGNTLLRDDWVRIKFCKNERAWYVSDVIYGDTSNLFYNDTTETIPAYAVMAVSGIHNFTGGLYCPKVEQTSTTYRKTYLVNGAVDVPSHTTGKFQNGEIVIVRHHTFFTPAIDELWGPRNASWYVYKGATSTTGSNGTNARTDWGIVVNGVVDSTNHLISGRQVCKGRARMCRAQAVISSGHSLSSVDNITAIDGGWNPVENDAMTLSVNSGFETDNDAWGIIVFREDNNTWDALDFPCPA